MQQVGEDEEFLRELLADLRNELDSQLATIAGIIQVRFWIFARSTCVHDTTPSALTPFFPYQNPQDSPYERIRQAAHFIKGAAGNLYCQPLRQASFDLEKAASAAHASATPDAVTAVQVTHAAFQQAALNFRNFLPTIGV